MKAKRIGMFSVPRDWIEEHPQEVVEMFFNLNMIVIRAEMMYHTMAIEYTALSPVFDLCPIEHMVPLYHLIRIQLNNDEVTYKVEKINA